MPRPVAPRAVRPARRTYSEGSRGKSNSTTWLTSGASMPRLTRSVATRMAGGCPGRNGSRNSCHAMKPSVFLLFFTEVFFESRVER